MHVAGVMHSHLPWQATTCSGVYWRMKASQQRRNQWCQYSRAPTRKTIAEPLFQREVCRFESLKFTSLQVRACIAQTFLRSSEIRLDSLPCSGKKRQFWPNLQESPGTISSTRATAQNPPKILTAMTGSTAALGLKRFWSSVLLRKGTCWLQLCQRKSGWCGLSPLEASGGKQCEDATKEHQRFMTPPAPLIIPAALTNKSTLNPKP